MRTPSAALAWELWRRHQKRLITLAGLLAGFALVYPKLCAHAGMNLRHGDALDALVTKLAAANAPAVLLQRVVQVLYGLFLACGPLAAMFLSLLFVTYMFIFTEFDPKNKYPMVFPSRLFTLPVSTPFLFWRIWLGGMVSVAALYGSWLCFVPMPRLNVFSPYMNCFGWMTLLALSQGIVWALGAWPVTRMLVLSAVFFAFSLSPARPDIFDSPLVLASLFVLGAVLARAGLQKMRHGQWQGWAWDGPVSARLRGPKRFASPAQAQLWLEWRRSARPLCFYAVLLAVTPIVVHVVWRLAAGLGPIQDNTLTGFAIYLAAVPLLIHFCAAVSPARADLPFLMNRPVTNGQIMTAALKATGISAVLSWVAVLAALCLMPLLGNFHAVEQSFATLAPFRTLAVLGLLALTWRLVAVSLCFTWSGRRRLAELPALLGSAGLGGAMILSALSQNGEYWDSFWRNVPGALAGLVAVKFLLALAAFRLCLKRKLLAPAAVAGYVAAWVALAGVLLVAAVISSHGSAGVLPTCLLIVLLTPLARIGLCPITLAWQRHA